MEKKTGWLRAAGAIEEDLVGAMKQSDIEGIGKYAEELDEHLQAVERTLEAYSTTGGLFCWIKAASNGETAGQSFKLPEAIKVAIALRIPTNETAVQIEDALRRADANRKYRELSEMVEWLSENPKHGIIEYETSTDAIARKLGWAGRGATSAERNGERRIRVARPARTWRLGQVNAELAERWTTVCTTAILESGLIAVRA